MFRFLARFIGLLLVAAGFVGLVIDGTRSLANTRLSLTPLGDVVSMAFPTAFAKLEPAVTYHIHPWLWDPVLLKLFLMPAGVVAALLGLFLLWLGRQPPEPFGYPAGR